MCTTARDGLASDTGGGRASEDEEAELTHLKGWQLPLPEVDGDLQQETS